ncbi:MAG TPA: hypothetical protein VHE33_01230 [Acidobacteriaceae bacterium]|nr:hypothetical protein [Acidobacteriaceae bacterium]
MKELVAMMTDMQQNKSDHDIAEKLMDVDLSEELTPAGIAQLAAMNPGPETTEQLHILVGESSMLAPPASELPTTAAPDGAAQRAIIDKTLNYITDFMRSPKLAADKTTARYQNGPDYVYSSGGGTMTLHADLGQKFSPDNPYFRNLGEHTMPVEILGGAEIRPAKIKASDPSTRNGQISQGGPGPLLGVAFEDAAKGKIQFARWETVGGKALAVFSFQVPKKQSHYEVDYCCFPHTESVGSHMAQPMTSSGSGSLGSGSGISTASAVYATNTTFNPFHAKVGYHGEFFIDPATGEIPRFIMQAEMRKSDFVNQEDTRIDYGPVTLEGKTIMVPQTSYVLTTVTPAGDSGQRIAERRTLFEVHYANYFQPGAGPRK